MKIICQWHKMLAKAGSNFCPTINKPSHNCQRLLKYRQNGKISSNLATFGRKNWNTKSLILFHFKKVKQNYKILSNTSSQAIKCATTTTYCFALKNVKRVNWNLCVLEILLSNKGNIKLQIQQQD